MTLVRQKEGVINTDKTAFLAAKRRKQQQDYIQSLEMRVTKLESTVKCLTSTIEEITKK